MCFMATPLRTFDGYEPPPDRLRWEREHGNHPWELTDVPAKFHAKAAAAVFRDESTINVADANRAKNDLEQTLVRVHAHFDMDENDLVFYRADDRTFWVYPA